MENKRQKQYAKLIHKDLGEIFQRHLPDLFKGAFATVTEVQVTPDLALAKVYISMLLAENKQSVIDSVAERKGEIRRLLGNKIGKQVRVVPDLHFILDELQDEATKMDKLIDGLDIPPAPPEE